MRKLSFLLALVLLVKLNYVLTGCAQIMSPGGGPKDTIPPKLLNAHPALSTVNFKGKTITLNFDEYIQVDQLQQNLLVSPAPNKTPQVDYKFRTVTIRLRDTLMPGTTYVLDFGNAIKDLNEGNIYKNFKYVFSTGPYIDSMTLSGKVNLAETGGVDSTMMALLYKDLSDSAPRVHRPNYIARINKEGAFKFTNLSPGVYKVYALKDESGSHLYTSKFETFAFLDTTVTVSSASPQVMLYAFAEEKEAPKTPTGNGGPKKKNDKRIKYSTPIVNENQDLLGPLTIEFQSSLKKLDTSQIRLTDTLFNSYKDVAVGMDSTRKKITIKHTWTEDTYYKLIINKDFAVDTFGNTLYKSDTITFKSKKTSDYGTVKLTFKNLDLTKNPVLELVSNTIIAYSHPLTASEWTSSILQPGDYEIRILYDRNKNGVWDPGNYKLKRQPELVYTIPQPFTIKANWDNEKDIELP